VPPAGPAARRQSTPPLGNPRGLGAGIGAAGPRRPAGNQKRGAGPLDALMLDTAEDARTLIGHLGLVGCLGVGRYLFAGATTSSGYVPQPVALPLSAAEVEGILASGLAILPVDNGIGYGDTTGPQAFVNGQQKALAAVRRAEALGVPAGTYIAFDLENWSVDAAFLSGYCGIMRQSPFGGAGIVYGSVSASWRYSLIRASAWDANVRRVLVWTARYIGPWAGVVPSWDPEDDAGSRTVLWQFTGQGPQGVDLDLVQLPLPSEGAITEGLWLPSGAAGSPDASAWAAVGVA
jgi:hypothetical protein